MQTYCFSRAPELLSSSQNHPPRHHAKPATPCGSHRQLSPTSSSFGGRKHKAAAQTSQGCSKLFASGSDSPSSSDSEYTSEHEADKTVTRLQRLNSIQKGYLDRQKSGEQDEKSICCWGKEGDGLPQHHTSRWVSQQHMCCPGA